MSPKLSEKREGAEWSDEAIDEETEALELEAVMDTLASCLDTPVEWSLDDWRASGAETQLPLCEWLG